MALPSPLRALCEHKPDRARKVIRAALTTTSGHRGKAASRLAASDLALESSHAAKSATKRPAESASIGRNVIRGERRTR